MENQLACPQKAHDIAMPDMLQDSLPEFSDREHLSESTVRVGKLAVVIVVADLVVVAIREQPRALTLVSTEPRRFEG